MRRPFGMICVGRWRLPRCQATRTRCSGSAPRISTSGSAAATTSTSLPSSSTSASPPRNATAFSRSSRNANPRVPVIAIRRRCRSSKSSTTVSAGPSVQRCWPLTCVARIMEVPFTEAFLHANRRPLSLENALKLLHLAVADDLDHRRRHLQRRRIFAPDLHVQCTAMRIEVLAALPALHHHEQIRIVDAGVALIGNAAPLLAGGLDALLGALDKGIPHLWFYLGGGDDIYHA